MDIGQDSIQKLHKSLKTPMYNFNTRKLQKNRNNKVGAQYLVMNLNLKIVNNEYYCFCQEDTNVR